MDAHQRNLDQPAAHAAGAGMPRRAALAAFGGAAAAAAVPASGVLGMQDSMTGLSHRHIGFDPEANRYVLPKLPYAYNALEPHIDEQTMKLHHDKHHAGYVNGLNNALDALEKVRSGAIPASEVKRWSRELAFNGSGHLLHVVFWNCMTPGGSECGGRVAEMIKRDFGSEEAFKEHFIAAASSVEGSGWGLLVLEPVAQKLMVMQAEKHQNLTVWGVIPLVAVDVWEHAYYLKYQNRRKEYVQAFMNVINWPHANRMLEGVLGGRRM